MVAARRLQTIMAHDISEQGAAEDPSLHVHIAGRGTLLGINEARTRDAYDQHRGDAPAKEDPQQPGADREHGRRKQPAAIEHDADKNQRDAAEIAIRIGRTELLIGGAARGALLVPRNRRAVGPFSPRAHCRLPKPIDRRRSSRSKISRGTSLSAAASTGTPRRVKVRRTR